MRALFLITLFGFFCAEPLWACESSFRLTPTMNESVEVVITTKNNNEKKQIQVEDADGFLSAYLISSYLKAQTVEGAKARRDFYQIWAEQIQRLAMTLWRGTYQDIVADALTSGKVASLKREEALKMISYIRKDLNQLAEDVRSSKKISEAQLNRFSSVVATFPSIFSYSIKKSKGSAVGNGETKFKATDLGTCPGKVTKFEVMPLKVIAIDLIPPLEPENEAVQ